LNRTTEEGEVCHRRGEGSSNRTAREGEVHRQGRRPQTTLVER
jgi:hypothetical protein